jgi:hypothetical protein
MKSDSLGSRIPIRIYDTAAARPSERGVTYFQDNASEAPGAPSLRAWEDAAYAIQSCVNLVSAGHHVITGACMTDFGGWTFCARRDLRDSLGRHGRVAIAIAWSPCIESAIDSAPMEAVLVGIGLATSHEDVARRGASEWAYAEGAPTAALVARIAALLSSHMRRLQAGESASIAIDGAPAGELKVMFAAPSQEAATRVSAAPRDPIGPHSREKTSTSPTATTSWAERLQRTLRRRPLGTLVAAIIGVAIVIAFFIQRTVQVDINGRRAHVLVLWLDGPNTTTTLAAEGAATP